jgi:threonine dehydrogenase-like Zn-dependent dehydrogenase
MSLSLELFRSAPRFLAAKAVGDRVPGLLSGPLAPLRLVNKRDPEPLANGWARIRPRLAGICGSDLAMLSGKSSFYFSPLVSLPFVPGHEVVGELLDDAGDIPTGTRVVLDPVLSCFARGVQLCQACAAGHLGRCDRVTQGHVSAGLQTGYCADTRGGWSRMMIAHRSQLHAVPDPVDDETAVLVEPLACAVHAALAAGVQPDDSVLVIGAGTVGLLVTLALRRLTDAGRITVVAKHQRQRELAMELGASETVSPERAVGALRRATRSVKLTPERGAPFLLGGVDVSLECVGSRSSLDLALRTTKAGGRVVLTGIPSQGADLTPVWYRELQLVGAYTSGTEQVYAEERSSFDLAMKLAAEAPLDGLVGARYPLARWRDAIDHALGAGRLGTVKVTFDPMES